MKLKMEARRWKMEVGRWSIFYLLSSICYLLATICHSAIIPDSRRIIWEAGVRNGGIIVDPTNTISAAKTVYTTLLTSVTTTGFQIALNACPSNQVVQLTNGIYTINATLTVPDGVILRG